MEQRRPALSAEETSQAYGYLTTTGRRTGNPHEIEIWFAARPGSHTVYLMSGGRDRADWVKNLLADPAVRFRIGGVTYSGTARPLEGTSEEQRAREALATKYYGWTSGDFPNDWCRTALPLAIDLDGMVANRAA